MTTGQFTQIHDTFKELIDEPEQRFHKFFDFYCESLKIDPNFSVARYLRSGKELIRMADIYFNEKDYFHSFVYYSRYVLLYLEKLKTHPEYATANKADMIEIKKQLHTKALPRAEKLKVFIKESFNKEAEISRKNKEEGLEKLKIAGQVPTAAAGDSSSSTAATTAELDRLKHQYQVENEIELNNLLEKERQRSAALFNNNNEIEAAAQRPSSASAASAPGMPFVDRSLKPKFQPHGEETSNKYNLRTLYVPSNVMEKFLNVAQFNTTRNIETCGILAGRLSQNLLIISHCIVPKQTGTSDTCCTEQEMELFDFVDRNNLITLGWIHTHPTQTAFLSSIDLHTHYAYQIMMPESIAIVCAPSYKQTGIFILSPSYGMREISDCKKNGFHPHTTNPPLFEECDHVIMDDKLDINLVDLRILSH